MHLGDIGYAMAMNDLERRVSELEGSFGFLTNQVKGVHTDLLGFQEKTEQHFDKVDGRLDRIESRLDHVEKGIKDLRHDMPGIVGGAMREVLHERDKTSRK
jgi:hypothetical protein